MTQIARTTMGVGYGGQALGHRVVRWERNHNKVHLREVDYDVVADPHTPIARAVRAANNQAIIMTFPIAAFGAGESAVIEVTRLFTSDVFELSARQRLNASSMDASRSYIERISPYPENIEVEATHTYSKTPPPPGAPSTPANPFTGAGMRPGSASVVLHRVIFSPVSKARQAEAVKFLNDSAFATPAWAIDPQILRRIEPVGVLSRIRNAQNSVLTNLLGSARFARLVEQSALDDAAAYQPAEFLADVRKGIWKELEAPQVRVDPYRRNLQRAYLDLVNSKLNGPAPAMPAQLPRDFPAAYFATSGDEKPFYRAELRALNAAVGAALARTSDRATRAHLEGARDQIARILDPKFAPPAAPSGGSLRVFGAGTCWPDYVIEP